MDHKIILLTSLIPMAVSFAYSVKISRFLHSNVAKEAAKKKLADESKEVDEILSLLKQGIGRFKEPERSKINGIRTFSNFLGNWVRNWTRKKKQGCYR